MKAPMYYLSILVITLISSMNAYAHSHVSVGVGIGVPAYYASVPVYYGPPPAYYYGSPAPYPDEYADDDITTTDVEWVPAHLEDGVWVPGRYVEYVTSAPGPDYIWVDGYWDRHHHWHRGHWNHHYYR